MVNGSEDSKFRDAMRQMNRAWLDGRLDDLFAFLHPEAVMVFPGFSGKAEGRDAFLAGFKEFETNATVHEFEQGEPKVDVVGPTAVVTYNYFMRYELAGVVYRATGRDLWVFQKQQIGWLAVWRTMLDLSETPD